MQPSNPALWQMILTGFSPADIWTHWFGRAAYSGATVPNVESIARKGHIPLSCRNGRRGGLVASLRTDRRQTGRDTFWLLSLGAKNRLCGPTAGARIYALGRASGVSCLHAEGLQNVGQFGIIGGQMQGRLKHSCLGAAVKPDA